MNEICSDLPHQVLGCWDVAKSETWVLAPNNQNVLLDGSNVITISNVSASSCWLASFAEKFAV
jgi:hypothetical protein